MRRRTFLAALTLVLSGLVAVPAATLTATTAGADDSPVGIDVPAIGGIPGSYVVTVRDGADPRLVALAAAVTPSFVYTSVINGFAGPISDAQLTVLQTHPDVLVIEQDQIATADTTQNTVHSGWDTWGLDRIDQRALPLSNTYTYNSTGTGVDVYVFDSGSRYSHVVFGGRNSLTYDAYGGDGSDCNGHGTHVAGTIGGGTLGVAVGVTLHTVKVLDCAGNGTLSGILGGMDVVRANHGARSVANMSLSFGGIVTTFNTALNNMITSGVTTVVSAGNRSQNACNYSPSSVTAAIVVAASDRTDKRATFSNHGSCVDLYAPGVDVWSSWYTTDNTVALVSGTSQASPHAAGVAALYMATSGVTNPASVQSYLVSNATSGVIRQNRTGTPNLLLYSNNL